jgi:anti-sigma regulatory factor (Ser/Thr protein kinase)
MISRITRMIPPARLSTSGRHEAPSLPKGREYKPPFRLPRTRRARARAAPGATHIRNLRTQAVAEQPFSASGVSLLVMAWEAETAPRASAEQQAHTGPPRRPGGGSLPAQPPGAMSYRYTTDLSAVRAVVYRYAIAAGLPESRAVDLVLAVSEVAANTVRHAKSPGSLKIWYDSEEIVCQIQDEGIIADPFAGRRRPSLEAMGGHGLWIVNQICDEVEMCSGETGTIIRLHMTLPRMKPGS